MENSSSRFKGSARPVTRSATDADVDRAFNSGRILRIHLLRPTWHFVTPTDIRWLLQLTAPHVHALNAYYYRTLDLDRGLFRRSHKLLSQALEGGKHRTRAELAQILHRGGVSARGQRLAYIVMHAELEGIVCSGALAELTRRFFTGHGPATLRHFVWWSGLRVADAKAGLAMVRPHLARTTLDGTTDWFGAPNPAGNSGSTSAYLLPEYDEALVGSRDFGDIDLGPAPGRDRWTDTWYRPVIVAGRRAGTWKRTIAKGRVLLETNLFAALTPAQSRALKIAAGRYGRFLGMPVTMP